MGWGIYWAVGVPWVHCEHQHTLLRMQTLVLACVLHFCRIISPMWKNVNHLFLQIHSSSNLRASKETNLFWHLSISLKWCTLWPESMSPTFLVNCNDCNFSFQRKSSSKLCVLLFEDPITWLLVWTFDTKNTQTHVFSAYYPNTW